MDKKIVPYSGIEVHYYDQYGGPIINVVIDGLAADKYQYFNIDDDKIHEVNPVIIERIRELDKALKREKNGMTTWPYPFTRFLLFVISGQPLLQHMKTKNVHTQPKYNEDTLYPTVNHVFDYNGEEFVVEMEKKYRRMSPSNKVHPAFIMKYLEIYTTPVVMVKGKTEADIIRALREELVFAPVVVTKGRVSQAIRKLYTDPKMIWHLGYALREYPTEDKLLKNFIEVKKAIEAYHANKFNVRKINIKLTSPPINIEAYRSAMMQIELTAVPELKERKCIMIRHRTADDELFDKTLTLLGIETVRKGNATYIETEYGAIVNVGEKYRLGEANQLTNRLIWIE